MRNSLGKIGLLLFLSLSHVGGGCARKDEEPGAAPPADSPAAANTPAPIVPAEAGKLSLDVALEKDGLEFVAESPYNRGTVTITAGNAAIDGPADNSKELSAKVKGGRVEVEVAKTTLPGDYWVTLRSTDAGKKGAKLKVRVNPAQPFVLENDGRLEIRPPRITDQDWTVLVRAKTGSIVHVPPPPPGSKVAWQYDEGRQAIAITLPKGSGNEIAGDHEMVVDGQNTAGRPDSARLRFKVAPPRDERFVLDDDGKLELRLDAGAAEESRILVKARSGTIVGTSVPQTGSKIHWQFFEDRQAVVISAARDATARDARDYEILVKGQDNSGKLDNVKLKFKAAAAPLALEREGDLEVKLGGGKREFAVKVKSGMIDSLSTPPAGSKVTWNFRDDTRTIAIKVAEDAGSRDLKDYPLRVIGKDGVGQPARLDLKVKVAVEPFELERTNLELKLQPEAGSATLAQVKVRSGTIAGLSPSPTPGKVSWKVDAGGKAIAIAAAGNATSADLKDYVVFVTGKDGMGQLSRQELKFKLSAAPFALENDGKIELQLGSPAAVLLKARSGAIVDLSPPPVKSRVTWEYQPGLKAIVISAASDANSSDLKDYRFKVTGKDGVGNLARTDVVFQVTARPFLLDDEGKLELKLGGGGELVVKARSGKIVQVLPPPADSRVRWKLDASGAIAITLSSEAEIADAREYEIHVRGQDGAGVPARALLKFKVVAD